MGYMLWVVFGPLMSVIYLIEELEQENRGGGSLMVGVSAKHTPFSDLWENVCSIGNFSSLRPPSGRIHKLTTLGRNPHPSGTSGKMCALLGILATQAPWWQDS